MPILGEARILGHVVSNDDISINEVKEKLLLEMHPLTMKQHLQGFVATLGTINTSSKSLTKTQDHYIDCSKSSKGWWNIHISI